MLTTGWYCTNNQEYKIYKDEFGSCVTLDFRTPSLAIQWQLKHSYTRCYISKVLFYNVIVHTLKNSPLTLASACTKTEHHTAWITSHLTSIRLFLKCFYGCAINYQHCVYNTEIFVTQSQLIWFDPSNGIPLTKSLWSLARSTEIIP